MLDIYVNAFPSQAHPEHLINCYILKNLFLRAPVEELKRIYTWRPSNGILVSYGNAIQKGVHRALISPPEPILLAFLTSWVTQHQAS